MANYTEPVVGEVSSDTFLAGVNDAITDPDLLEVLESLLADAEDPTTGEIVRSVLSAETGLSGIEPGAAALTMITDAADGVVSVDLKELSKEAIADLKVITFSGEAPVVASLVKEFSGVVVLGSGDNTLIARGSNSITVQTGAGADSVQLAAGADSLVLAGGSDSVRAGQGDDEISVTNAEADDVITIAAGLGNDSLDLSALEIASVGKSGGFTEITLDNGAVIRVRGVDEILYTDSEGDIQEVGIKAFRAIDFE